MFHSCTVDTAAVSYRKVNILLFHPLPFIDLTNEIWMDKQNLVPNQSNKLKK